MDDLFPDRLPFLYHRCRSRRLFLPHPLTALHPRLPTYTNLLPYSAAADAHLPHSLPVTRGRA